MGLTKLFNLDLTKAQKDAKTFGGRPALIKYLQNEVFYLETKVKFQEKLLTNLGNLVAKEDQEKAQEIIVKIMEEEFGNKKQETAQ